MASVNGFSPQGIADLTTKAGIAKTRLTWGKLAVKSFFGGVFISLGGLVNLIVLAGSPGLRESNPALAKLIAAFVFPMGFVLVTLTNMELCTSSLFVLPFTTLQRKTSVRATAKNLFVSYIGNVCGALFVAGVMAWWSNVLDTDTMTSYAVTQAEARVNVAWSVNFLRGIGCNFFVALAFFMSLGAVEYVSKICTIWVPIWAFVIAGYQHSIANYFMIPIGMFYGTNFGVGRFIYQSIIPVTLGNLVGGVVLGVLPFWYLYGREVDNAEGAQTAGEEAKIKERRSRDSGNETVVGEGPAGYDRDGMTRAV